VISANCHRKQCRANNARRRTSMRRGGAALALAVLLLPLAAAAAPNISVAGLFKGQAILVIDGKQHLLKNGDTSPEGVKLIEANSKEAVLEIDGERRSYQLGGGISATYKDGRNSVRLLPDDRGHYFVTGKINQQPIRFLVDTGASYISLNQNQAERLGIDFRKGKVGLSSTASGVIESFLIELDRVSIQSIEQHRVGAVVNPGDFPKEALLGNSFLNQLHIKREGKVLELVQP